MENFSEQYIYDDEYAETGEYHLKNIQEDQELIQAWWESNDETNAAFLVTSVDEDHPLAGCWTEEALKTEAEKLGLKVEII